MELAHMMSQLITLGWNVGSSDYSPRFVGWMRLYFVPFLDGRTHETEAGPGVWDLHDGPMPMSLLANVCDCIQDFRMCPGVQLPGLVDEELRRTLVALIGKFGCQTPAQTQWRFMPMAEAQNAAFYALL
eukprot:6988589-Prymnesium_polylepis.1